MIKRGRPKQEISAECALPPIRITLEQRENYEAATQFEGKSLSSWLKTLADLRVSKIVNI